MRTDFEIVGSFNKLPIKAFDAQRTVNMFEYTSAEGKRGKILLPTSGLNLQFEVAVGSHGWRASFVFKDFVYFVVENQVFRADKTNLIPAPIGMLTTSGGFVGIEANTFQVIFVDGVNGYIYDTTVGTFTQIVSAGFPAIPIDVTFLDGFFIVPAGGTNAFTLSNLNDGTTWDALNSAAINTHPGTITALITLHRKLFIFSQVFTEVWENAGLNDFPLRRNNSLLMEYGTISAGSVVVGFDKLFFLSNDQQGLGHVIMVSGTQAIPVSTPALDYELINYTSTADGSGIIYQDAWGLVFYRLNFTQANVTWVFNVSQSTPEDLRWHNEEMLDGSRHVAQTHFYINERHFFGAYNSGKCYEIDNQTYTNNGETIKRERITDIFYDEKNNRIRTDRLFVDLVQGVTPAVGNDAISYVFLAISRDGGRTYGNELKKRVGKIGETTYATKFRKLGVARTFTFRVRCYNHIKFVILGATIDYEVLPE